MLENSNETEKGVLYCINLLELDEKQQQVVLCTAYPWQEREKGLLMSVSQRTYQYWWLGLALHV